MTEENETAPEATQAAPQPEEQPSLATEPAQEPPQQATAPADEQPTETAADEADAAPSAPIEDADPRPELRQLMELAVKFPEIGPPLAELAFKIGHRDIGERIVKMGLDDESTTGVEFYAVAVDVARREGRYEEVFAQVEDALQTFTDAEDANVSDDDANRLLHLVRSAFAVLLFDLEDVNAKPDWVRRLAEQLPRLEARYGEDPFFYSLLAQALWFTDKEQSEATWDKAVALGDGEFAWNARGTWYKDAAHDFDAAQKAYRQGLQKLKDSALLLHNLAQLLTDEAEKQLKEQPDNARGWLREADELVRRALRKDARRGLRRYIHGTRDRIQKLAHKLPAEEIEPPKVDDVLKGKVIAVVDYGCFVTVRGGLKGLLHKSELAWERVNDPNQVVKVGDQIQVKVISVEPQDDGTVRVSFSRKALLKAPEGGAAEQAPPREAASGEREGGRGRSRRGRGRGGREGGEGRRQEDARPQGGGGSGGGGGGGGRESGNRGGRDGGNRGGRDGGNRGKGGRGGRDGGAPRGHRENPKREDGMGSLGELLLAKLEEAKGGKEQSED